MRCRDARGQAPVQEELGPDIGRAFSVRGFHWERGKRARTAVVPAAAYLPAALEARTEGWGKAAASTPSIAWIETRYGNVLRRSGRDRRTPAALAFFRCDRRRGTQPGRPGRDDRAADRMVVGGLSHQESGCIRALLGLLPGRPQVVITDSDNAIGGAVATALPRQDAAPPEHAWASGTLAARCAADCSVRARRARPARGGARLKSSRPTGCASHPRPPPDRRRGHRRGRVLRH